MRGTVEIVNPSNGNFAVRTSEGLTVVELMDRITVEVGDEIAGNLTEHGSVTLRHVASGERFDAFIQAVDASVESARESMR
jgi:hypothetical protein